MQETVKNKIQSQIDSNNIILYMKGSKESPMCGFSSQVVKILNSYGIDYATVDVLSDQEIREGIKEFSEWPTIPQLYVNGKFIGGCDICSEMHFNGELKSLIANQQL
ncbi:MAG: Grx4 family monothiol glutaredoxin [Thermodesulfobacteriota bacterium]